jgi:hypothetical protein
VQNFEVMPGEFNAGKISTQVLSSPQQENKIK